MKTLYSLKNITLEYRLSGVGDDTIPPVKALDHLTLDILENELLVILGANGSGKSSLGKLLAGLAGKFSGEIYYKDKLVTEYKRDIFSDVAMALQEPQNQLLMPTVKKELSYPLENRKLGKEAIELRVKEYAELFGLDNVLAKTPDMLSGGQITSLALASALITEPEVIILDEPDSHFDTARRDVLNRLIEKYRHNKTIILITQFVDMAKAADRVIILDDGAVVGFGKPNNVLNDESNLRKYGLYNSVAAKNDQYIHKSKKSRSLNLVIKAENVTYAYKETPPVLHDINLIINAGEKIGLVGTMGSGKTTMGLLIAGLLKPKSGRIELHGKAIGDYDEITLRRLITMSMQFPERALFEETIEADIALGPGNLGYDNISEIVDWNLDRFGINHLRQRHPFTLSGGEKRKAALAGILAMNTQIIVLDEPTAALDYKSQNELLELLGNSDKTLIIISHDPAIIRKLCNRVIKIFDGQIVDDRLKFII